MAVRTPAPRPAMRRANRRACRIVCEATDNPKVPEGLVAPPPPVPLPPEMEARRQELAKAAALEAKLKVQAAKAASDAAKAKARAETIAAAEAAAWLRTPRGPRGPRWGTLVESRKRPTASGSWDEMIPRTRRTVRHQVRLPIPGGLRLSPNFDALRAPALRRDQRFEGRLEEIEKNHGTLQAFAESYKEYGLHPKPDGAPGDVRYVEYAPGAKRLSLMGDFNGWKAWEFEGERDEFGKWTLDVPAAAGLKHGSQVRVVMESHDGRQFDRVPAWIQRIVQCCDEESGETRCYHNGVYHDPPEGERHEWRHEKPRVRPASLRIYEAHVGMSSEETRCGTYREFADEVLPRVKELGITAAAHGRRVPRLLRLVRYQVTNFFAAAAERRSGGLYLGDKCHGMEMQCFMDVVHAHAATTPSTGSTSSTDRRSPLPRDP